MFVLLFFSVSKSYSEEQPPPRLSVLENYVNQTIAPYFNENQVVRQFGYDIFGRPAAFDPSDLMPVGPDYLLRPGDELKISFWGKISSDLSVRIGRDGSVSLGEFGVLHPAGLTFAEAKAYLQEVVARYYKPSEVKMNLSMGALSSMRVFVAGSASNPGSFTVSSMSSILNALMAAGGPSKSGSMRSITLHRNGKVVSGLDLYDLLLKGDKSGDIRLQPDDVIFIPPVGPQVAVAGYVKSPGIYELKGESSIKEAIEMAGGIDALAYSGRLKIDRIAEGGRTAAFEWKYDDELIKTGVRPGDIITIFHAVADKKHVRLEGAVKREGEYGVNGKLTVSGLINLAGGVEPYSYTREAELTRVDPTPAGPKTTKFFIDLDKAMAGNALHDIELKGDDYLYVKTIPEWRLYRKVKVSGEVKFPGTYIVEKGETISSLLSRAGGLTDKAFFKGAVFTRVSVREVQQKQLDESISRLEYELFSSSAEAIETASDPQSAEQLRLSMVQKKALIAKLKSAQALGRIVINLEPIDKFKGSVYDIELLDGDEVRIPEVPAQVQVVGSVYNQTALVYSPELSVSEYINTAGGVTKYAAEDEIYILKMNGTAINSRQAGNWSVGWDKVTGRWVTGFMSSSLDPGDTIVVPEKTDRIAWLKETKDLTQILYQIAVTAGVLIVAF
ncbi:MAG: hypothetical protein A2V21_303360 [Deltaproteobacteria bacterium GWC2_55_46]|nr:MAG: hypothetical protein A2Z79_12290 [Deltaproteobacteria bacterium GWA2_55_82]OGQ63951.1 MAG: hypothetical protein A3I81_07820 [Deltaproteobacteria bacterium RIFCSPLOWO2_02_FULL_55_12]OIJ73383.1 MAG: hypothetical protein A2V21_303360 [Deltaproteobacteria bacterium GWC2_55_46]